MAVYTVIERDTQASNMNNMAVWSVAGMGYLFHCLDLWYVELHHVLNAHLESDH